MDVPQFVSAFLLLASMLTASTFDNYEKSVLNLHVQFFCKEVSLHLIELNTKEHDYWILW